MHTLKMLRLSRPNLIVTVFSLKHINDSEFNRTLMTVGGTCDTQMRPVTGVD